MTELTITTSRIEGDTPVSIFHLKGHLHGPTEEQLTGIAKETFDDGVRHFLLDLTDIELLSSAGLRGIQRVFKMVTPSEDADLMRKVDGEPYKSPYMKIVCPNPQIYYILNITGFMQNMLVYNNLEEAKKSFAG